MKGRATEGRVDKFSHQFDRPRVQHLQGVFQLPRVKRANARRGLSTGHAPSETPAGQRIPSARRVLSPPRIDTKLVNVRPRVRAVPEPPPHLHVAASSRRTRPQHVRGSRGLRVSIFDETIDAASQEAPVVQHEGSRRHRHLHLLGGRVSCPVHVRCPTP